MTKETMKWWQRSSLVAAGLFAGLLLVELGLSLVELPMHGQWYDLSITLDAHCLFRIDSHARHDFNVLGYRDVEFETNKKEKHRVLVVGDSFTMGANVFPNLTFAKQLEKMLGDGTKVYNMGIIGYGPDQSLVRLVDEGLALEPDLVVLQLFPANDFEDLYKNRLFLIDDSGELVESRFNALDRALPRIRLTMIWNKLIEGQYLAEADYEKLISLLFLDQPTLLLPRDSDQAQYRIELMRMLLKRYRDILRAQGVSFLVLIIPSYEAVIAPTLLSRAGIEPSDFLINERTAADLCDQLGVEVLDATSAIAAERARIPYVDSDRHLSQFGHRVIAALLAERVRAQLAVGQS